MRAQVKSLRKRLGLTSSSNERGRERASGAEPWWQNQRSVAGPVLKVPVRKRGAERALIDGRRFGLNETRAL